MKVFQSVFFTFWAFSFTNWQLTVEVFKKLRYNFPPPRRKLNPDLWHIRLLCYNYTNLICESEKISQLPIWNKIQVSVYSSMNNDKLTVNNE